MDTTTSNNSLSTFISALVLNGTICVAFFIAFSIFRPKNKYLYSPKTALKTIALAPKLPQNTLFGWLPAVLRLSHDQLLQYCGPDGFMFLYFLKQNVYIFLILSFFGMGVILPINITDSDNTNGLNKTTMSNIRRGSPKLWTHVVFSIIFSLVVIVFNFAASVKSISIRQNYLNSEKYRKTLRSVTTLVTGIPKSENNHDTLNAAFSSETQSSFELYPAKFSKELDKSVENRNKAHLKLEGELMRLAKLSKQNVIKSQQGKKIKPCTRSTMRTGFLGLLGSKEDIVDYCTAQIINENNTILETSVGASSASIPRTNSALVVFETVEDAHEFGYVDKVKKLASPNSYFRRVIDVDTEDIIWENLSVNNYAYFGLRAISVLLTVLMVLFWIIPTTIIFGIANLDNLQKLSPFKWVANLPTAVLGVLQGIVPAVVLAVLTMLVPIILRIFIRFEKPLLSSQVELKLCDRFFYFLLFNNFFIYLIIGTVVGSLNEFINKPTGFLEDFFNDPQRVLNIISSSVPSNSTFYTTYVLLLGLSSSSGNILQIVGLVLRWLFGSLFSYTPRKTMVANAPQPIFIGVMIPIISFVFVLGVIFSVIAPVMTLVSLVFFTLFSLVYRYNFVYIYDPHSFNYGGHSATKMISHRWAALYCFQIVMLFLLAVNTKSDNKANSIVRLALMVITIVVTASSHAYFAFFLSKKLYYLESVVEERRGGGFLASTINKMVERDMNSPTQFISEEFDEVYKYGYVLLDDKQHKLQFVNPRFRDSGYTTVWVPESNEPEMNELYNQVNIELGDRGTVTDENVVFKDNCKLRVFVDKAPDHLSPEPVLRSRSGSATGTQAGTEAGSRLGK